MRQPTRWLGFTAGVRYDRNSAIDNRVSPRAALFISEPEKYGLKHGSPHGDDERGHHGLGMTGLEPVQRAEQDGAGNEQPCVRAALLEQVRQVGHSVTSNRFGRRR